MRWKFSALLLVPNLANDQKQALFEPVCTLGDALKLPFRTMIVDQLSHAAKGKILDHFVGKEIMRKA